MSVWLDFDCTEDQAEARGDAIAKACDIPTCDYAGNYKVQGKKKSAAGLYRAILRIAQETKDV
jgi:hypothetical protein